MIGYKKNIEKIARANTYFRKVLYTGQHAQLVVMSLKPKEEIGLEVHEIVDQFIRIEEGEGTVIMNGQQQAIKSGDAIIVLAGTKHNIINTSDKPLQLYTVYSPPHHKKDAVHKTKKAAEKDASDHI